ncbi:MAG: hypothetical protein GTO55_00820 [Armatimonadetes bacterium]|nr:hypothetical protein [Armatimonadota bacterium]NIM22826.1 hypothetical protein [Armatimonadota bacterium]NIM66693.1 hypothetical protein [Armatimonadota bacterium]NIM75250.1 hypothetical protein [Armatimonadota bacterium]NIN04891.1 hypothetical protein [Armatimonadota bacterium]
MRVYMAVLVAVMLGLGGAAGWAYPTLGGATGLVTLPTAEVVPAGAVDLAVDYQEVDIGAKALGGSLGMYGEAEMLPIRAVAGVGENAEVWAAYNKVKVDPGGEDLKMWNVGGKYMIAHEEKDSASAAIGLSYGKIDNGDDARVTTIFVVVSKSLGFGGGAGVASAKAHLGAIWMNFDSPISEELSRPFVGLEFTGENGSILAVEYRKRASGIDVDTPFAAVLRYPVGGTKPLWLEVGTTNAALGGIGLDEDDVFFGLCYRFGGAAGAAAGRAPTQPWDY